MFQRGRLDHFALNATSEETFSELHRRVMAEGRDDGEVNDMGAVLLFSFTDPDEGRHDVVWWKPGRPTDRVKRADWKRVEMD